MFFLEVLAEGLVFEGKGEIANPKKYKRTKISSEIGKNIIDIFKEGLEHGMLDVLDIWKKITRTICKLIDGTLCKNCFKD